MTRGARRAVAAELARLGLAPQRRRGQTFLVDPAWAQRIADWAGVGPADTVIEVGPGLGILTRRLAAQAGRVIAIEIDSGIARALQRGEPMPGRVEIVHADALRVDLAALARAASLPPHLVSNLPFASSAPLLRRFLGARDALEQALVVLQREVGERLLARPGQPAYGSLAALVHRVADVEHLGDVGPSHFHPPPRVTSSVLRIRPHRPSSISAAEFLGFERVLRAGFGQRRKTLANALRASWPPGAIPERAALEAAIRSAGIDPAARAEHLDPEALFDLAGALARAGLSPPPRLDEASPRGPDPLGGPAAGSGAGAGVLTGAESPPYALSPLEGNRAGRSPSGPTQPASAPRAGAPPRDRAPRGE